jgi:tetratricopeptide (TPR) repeat protein
LDEAELALLEIVAVFVDGWTVEAAAEVAGLSEDRALELTEALARHSLVQLHSTEFGRRARMLETIREFVAERLAARPDIAEVERRHANHYRGLVEQADRPLRGAGHSEWLGRLDLEAGNLATAIGWYLAHDPLPLPRLFRILFTFWTVRDHNTQAGTWLAQLVPAAGYFEPEARAELLWTAFVTARDVGDHAAALAARDQLEPLLEQVRDPYMHATSELAMAWASAVDDDFDDALRRALSSLERLRRQDEPIWTGVAAATVGTIEAALDRTEDAYDHLHEAQALAERFDSRWLSAWCRVQLGIVAVARDELADARAVLDEGLELSLIAHTTQVVAMCLAAFARLAFAEGDAEQAARLAGGAAGLRRRAGLTAWPTQRYAEDELAAVVREKLGSRRFDHLFLAGSQLSRHDAVAACRERPRSLSRPAHG